VHVPPPVPQPLCVVPGPHVPPSQQPPLQSDDGLQLVEHTPPLQALPGRQSVSVLQPQLPATQAEPFLPVQSTQAELEPHALGAVPDMHVPIDPPQQ